MYPLWPGRQRYEMLETHATLGTSLMGDPSARRICDKEPSLAWCTPVDSPFA
jgi:hypothetical protein